MVSLISCAKNEKPYLSEWLSYNLNLGFDRIMLFDNRRKWRTQVQWQG